MDIGTGKDLQDYIVNGYQVPYHLVDIVDAGYKYNVFEFQRDFTTAFLDITARGFTPILCGGTGMYIEAALKGYKLIQVPSDPDFRAWCNNKSDDDLILELRKFKNLHNTTDIDTRRRIIRALEIERYYANNPHIDVHYPMFQPIVIGVSIDRETRRTRIDTRLKTRIDEGMIDEAQKLLDSGITPETLIYYGLEYKFLAQYLTGLISYTDFVEQLNIAIHQFAKRQMTWFRGMERRGITIHWVDGLAPYDERVEACLAIIAQHSMNAKTVQI
jgi:tRNA dimethylallyltransferase